MDKIFNWISIAFGIGGGFLASALGGWDKWLIALAAFVVLDYLTGLAKAAVKKEISSAIGFKGIIKKVLIFVVVTVGVLLQKLTGDVFPLRDIVVCFYIANEGISLLENASEFIPLPAKLKEVLLQIRDKNAGKEKAE